MTFEEWMEQAYYPGYPQEGWEVDDMREAWDAAYEAGMDAGITYMLMADATTQNKIGLVSDRANKCADSPDDGAQKCEHRKDWNEVD